jgi:hypothetical protein
VIIEERKRMESLFPVDYEAYGKRVPLFFPSFRKAPAYQNGPFNWALYRKNKEHQAAESVDGALNPYAIGGGFLAYCIKKGWLIKEGSGSKTRYFATEKGRKKLADLRIQRAALMRLYKEEHPKVQEIDRQIGTVKNSIEQGVLGIVSSMKIRERALQENLERLETD